jgi:chorismate mutase/prephenate dehydratase
VCSSDLVGALMHLLEPFVEHGINVRKIENSTSSAKEVVRFFLEVSGHQHDPSILSVLEQLRAREVEVKVLGSYPASAWVETL